MAPLAPLNYTRLERDPWTGGRRGSACSTRSGRPTKRTWCIWRILKGLRWWSAWWSISPRPLLNHTRLWTRGRAGTLQAQAAGGGGGQGTDLIACCLPQHLLYYHHYRFVWSLVAYHSTCITSTDSYDCLQPITALALFISLNDCMEPITAHGCMLHVVCQVGWCLKIFIFMFITGFQLKFFQSKCNLIFKTFF